MLEARVERLKKELVVVKGIFMQQTLGCTPTAADVAGAVSEVGDVTGLGVEGLGALGGVDECSLRGAGGGNGGGGDGGGGGGGAHERIVDLTDLQTGLEVSSELSH